MPDSDAATQTQLINVLGRLSWQDVLDDLFANLKLRALDAEDYRLVPAPKLPPQATLATQVAQ